MPSSDALAPFRCVVDNALAPILADLIAIRQRLDRCFPPPTPYAHVAATLRPWPPAPTIAKRSTATQTAPTAPEIPTPSTTTAPPVPVPVVTPTPPPVVSNATLSTGSPPTAIKDACCRIEAVLEEIHDLPSDKPDNAFLHVLDVIGYGPTEDDTDNMVNKLRLLGITTFHALMRARSDTLDTTFAAPDMPLWRSLVYWCRLYRMTRDEFLALDEPQFD